MDMASMVDAVEANLFAFFPLLGRWPRAEAHDDPDMIWTLSSAPFPLFNSVLRANFEPIGVEAGIEKAVSRCRERRVPMLWWTGPSSKPSGLDQRLVEYGFFADQATGMSIDLTVAHGGHGGFGGHGDFQFEPVLDQSTLKVWCKVLCDGFGAPEAFGDAFPDFALTVGLAAPSPAAFPRARERPAGGDAVDLHRRRCRRYLRRDDAAGVAAPGHRRRDHILRAR
jgi:hypothetical protein